MRSFLRLVAILALALATALSAPLITLADSPTETEQESAAQTTEENLDGLATEDAFESANAAAVARYSSVAIPTGELAPIPEEEPELSAQAEPAQADSIGPTIGDNHSRPPVDEGPLTPSAVPSPTSSYLGGSIPILRLNFDDDVDPATGEVILTGDEKFQLVNESPDHSYRATGVTLAIEVPASYDNPEDGLWDGASGYTGIDELELEYLRGRGNSTWEQDKKPYKLKFDKSVDLFGMGANKHWALLANVIDESLSLDRMVGWLGEQLGMPYTPRGVPVDLFVDDEYYGSYFMTGDVRIGKGRVDIDEVSADASDPDSTEITGGYLLGMESKTDAPMDDWFTTSRGTEFTYDTPEYEPPLSDAGIAQQAYLKSFLDRVEDALNGEELTSASGESVWDLVDARSAADYWWVQEFTCNPDAFITPSTYLYKLRDTQAADGSTTTGKLYFGPLWDFDFVWYGDKTEGFDNTQANWIALMRQDPAFVDLLKERWAVLNQALEELTRPGGLMDDYLAELSDSWDADHERWAKPMGPDEEPPDPGEEGSSGDGYESAEPEAQIASLQDALERLRGRFDARRAWINAHLDELGTTFHTITFMDGSEVFETARVRSNSTENPFPSDPPDKGNLCFQGWFNDDGEKYDPFAPIDKDEVFYAQYFEYDDVDVATDIFFPLPEVWVSLYEDGTLLRYSILPADAVDQRIIWTSSDTSVVDVSEDGILSTQAGSVGPSGTAEATITARLVGSGEEASVRVVVYDPSVITLPAPTSVTFEDDILVGVGEYHQITIDSEPYPNSLYGEYSIWYSTNDQSIADVTNEGVIIGKSAGTTTILATVYGPNSWEVLHQKEITVTVLEPEDEFHATTEPGLRENLYAITYDLNGGSFKGSTDDIVELHRTGKRIKIHAAPTRKGYEFLYWKGSEYQPGDVYKVTGDHTFTAQWRRTGSESPRLLPKTGDETSLLPSLLALAGSACAFALARIARKRDA